MCWDAATKGGAFLVGGGGIAMSEIRLTAADLAKLGPDARQRVAEALAEHTGATVSVGDAQAAPPAPSPTGAEPAVMAPTMAPPAQPIASEGGWAHRIA